MATTQSQQQQVLLGTFALRSAYYWSVSWTLAARCRSQEAHACCGCSRVARTKTVAASDPRLRERYARLVRRPLRRCSWQSGSAANGNGARNDSTDGEARLPQRLIILCDGTWEARLQVMSRFEYGTNTSRPLTGEYYTNVALLNMAIPTVSRPDKNGQRWRQVCHYATGIGSGQLSLLAKAFTAATGSSLVIKVQEAYGFLCDNYQDGDEIFLFGFSRGAYTARAITGFINWAGILKKASDYPTDDGHIINESIFFNEIFDAYEKRKPGDAKSIQHAAQVLYDKLGRWPSEGADDTVTIQHLNVKGQDVSTPTTPIERSESGAMKNDEITVPPTIKVVGVWDTVGALGIPGFFQESKLFSFLDPGLSSNVQFAFQALALAEDRKDFLPTLWYRPWPSQIPENDHRRKNQVLRQMWFCGSHGDVGGGKGDHGLSDIALAWMVAQLTDTTSGSGNAPLLDVNLDVLKFLQDRRKQWARQLPNTSRSPFTFQATRDVKAKPEDQEPKDVVWKNNVYTGCTNEQIHHSVVASGRFSPDSPQFRDLKAKSPELLAQLWKQASDPESLSATEKALRWTDEQVKSPPQNKPPNILFRVVLKTLRLVSNVSATVIADVVNLRLIPSDEQVNLKAVVAEWADKKLRGE